MFAGYGDHRDLHVLTHSFPTRLSSDLSATKLNRLTTFSGVPVNLSRSEGFCVQMPTGQVLEWHCRTRMQPMAISEAVPMPHRSEEHTSELQSLMRNSYAVFCLKQKSKKKQPLYS